MKSVKVLMRLCDLDGSSQIPCIIFCVVVTTTKITSCESSCGRPLLCPFGKYDVRRVLLITLSCSNTKSNGFVHWREETVTTPGHRADEVSG